MNFGEATAIERGNFRDVIRDTYLELEIKEEDADYFRQRVCAKAGGVKYI